MGLAKRIIPCLDIRDGRVVKGIKFKNLRDSGDPAELGRHYSHEGADELVLLDVSASRENRRIILDVVRRVAENVDIPFTVGGGIKGVEDAEEILCSGADKISVNTSAVKNPHLITELRDRFGSNCVVVAIDAKRVTSSIGGEFFEVYIYGGSRPTGLDVVEWAVEAEVLGAGEILLTSIDRDGTRDGFDLELVRVVSESVNIPVIASGGAGNHIHFLELFKFTNADAGLAASVFHFGDLSIKSLKRFLWRNGVNVRLY